MKKDTKKLIFFDIDGTLMSRQGVVEESTLTSLMKLKEAGHSIFLATGRNHFDVPKMVLKIGFRGLVLGDGAYVELDGKELIHRTMDKKHVDRLSEAIEDGGGHLFYGGKDSGYITAYSRPHFETWVKELLKESPLWAEMENSITVVDDLKKVSDQKIEKIVYYDFKGNLKDLKQDFSENFMILPSNIADMSDESKGEITQLGVTKAYGIEILLAHLEETKENMIAFGDGFNDIEMINLAKIGVAMGNGVPPLKDCADLITAPIGDGGIYKALKELKLIV